MRRFHRRLLEEMVRTRPSDAQNHYALAEAYLATRPAQQDEARRAFERFIELSDDKKKATLRAGRKLAQANALPQAAAIYRKLTPEEIALLEEIGD